MHRGGVCAETHTPAQHVVFSLCINLECNSPRLPTHRYMVFFSLSLSLSLSLSRHVSYLPLSLSLSSPSRSFPTPPPPPPPPATFNALLVSSLHPFFLSFSFVPAREQGCWGKVVSSQRPPHHS